jgi:hypothetical protein
MGTGGTDGFAGISGGYFQPAKVDSVKAIGGVNLKVGLNVKGPFEFALAQGTTDTVLPHIDAGDIFRRMVICNRHTFTGRQPFGVGKSLFIHKFTPNGTVGILILVDAYAGNICGCTDSAISKSFKYSTIGGRCKPVVTNVKC